MTRADGHDGGEGDLSLRGQTAEWVNAVARNHGLYHMPVRGEPKCRTIGLLHAIAHNILRGVALCARAAVATEST